MEQKSMPEDYQKWRKQIEFLIEQAKTRAVMGVNKELLALYWNIGNDILEKQEKQGWGTQVIVQLSRDLTAKFPGDRGYSERNLRNMKQFAKSYPLFPIWQVPLAKLKSIWQVPLAELPVCDENVSIPLTQITWYHHISLLSKVNDEAERAFYIMETARNGWSRDTMLMQVDNGYIHAVGKAVNNFAKTLPAYQSDLAQYAFKDPYNFSFLGTVALQNELDIERTLTRKVTDFLLEMGNGFSFVGRQYHVTVDGDDYYIDILMYHVKLHCYVAVETARYSTSGRTPWWDMTDPETRRREIAGLMEASRVTGCDRLIIITKDEEATITNRGKTIRVVPAHKWLLP